ncbi:hypothetical protein C7974DRAFT_388685 [Boeremia exigua]|uniref:uncharacterized protein n=1 Tax=Boeremia exigua TaxID=749465 RepID=UPI001E8D433B|nr:uncharacterized protein C7974DRAFT_388685 [Boeremia exigua]KAH6639519.1 hypothetical protein C7974DRAFT_388685 [Boeremia exigua]
MPQLVARPGRNAVRQAKKAKEIRHVKGAIVWHAKQRRARQEKMSNQYEEKQLALQRTRWENDNIIRVRRTALRNAAEDWKLGPLRPNRAVHLADGKYGALPATRMQKPSIDADVWHRLNARREKKGHAPKYPLVVDSQPYFPMVKGDRVVVVRGRDRGKIGTVQSVMPRTHECLVSGVNRAYVDSVVFGSNTQDMGARQVIETPTPMDDLRLVIPYASADFTLRGQSIYEDVVVDNVVLERHTTGIDPFTGTDYGRAEIPKEHQYDPETGLPIFHRYIAGTRYRIAWPWETEKAADAAPEPAKEAAQGWLSKTLGTLRHPITTLQSWRAPAAEAPAPAPSTLPLSAQVAELEFSELEEQRRATVRSEDPERKDAYDAVDTTRNLVEGSDSMSYTLVAPPFPESLTEELRGDIFQLTQRTRNDTDAPHKPVRAKFLSPKAQAAQEYAQKKARAAERMKTPMQLRWEQEQARKKAALKDGPAVDTDTLLAALGQHMQANGVRLGRKKRAVELD